MQINLSDVSSVEGKKIEKTFEYENDSFVIQGEKFPIVSQKPINIIIQNIGKGKVEIFLNTEFTVAIPCNRCTKEVDTIISIDFNEKIDMKLTDEERINVLDECSYLTGTNLDVDRLVYLEVLMSWPLKVLCKDDCKGLCSHCGMDLNTGTCNCDNLPKDPRMAAISDIFRNFKEV